MEAFINSLTGPGISKPHFRKFLIYVLKFVECNWAKYEKLKSELGALKEEAASIKDELTTLMISYRVPPEPSAPQAMAPVPPSAPQAAAPSPPSAFQAAAPPQPSASQATAPIPPLASQAMVQKQLHCRALDAG